MVRENNQLVMTEADAREATALRAAALAAMARGDALGAREALEALKAYDSTEALTILTGIYIESKNEKDAEKALSELKEISPKAPMTEYLVLRLRFMKGERAALIEPLEGLLREEMPSSARQRAANLLGRCYRWMGECEKSATWDMEAVMCAGDERAAAAEYGNYLFGRHFLTGRSPEDDRAAASRYDDFFSGVKRFRHRRRTYERPLRVGYISADFCYHVVLRFVAVFLWGEGKVPFSVYAYMLGNEDAYSRELKGRVEGWRNLKGLSPREAARRIYEDDIDILVDFGGHTTGNALPILAYKPAPVQISGIGYWASTGLSAVDYFLGDPYLDDERTQKAFTEKLLIMPRTHFCYTVVGKMPEPSEKPPLLLVKLIADHLLRWGQAPLI